MPHRVYFGTNPTGLAYIGEQTSASYSPSLISGNVYYWRIDEVSSTGHVVSGQIQCAMTGANILPSAFTVTGVQDLVYIKWTTPIDFSDVYYYLMRKSTSPMTPEVFESATRLYSPVDWGTGNHDNDALAYIDYNVSGNQTLYYGLKVFKISLGASGTELISARVAIPSQTAQTIVSGRPRVMYSSGLWNITRDKLHSGILSTIQAFNYLLSDPWGNQGFCAEINQSGVYMNVYDNNPNNWTYTFPSTKATNITWEEVGRVFSSVLGKGAIIAHLTNDSISRNKVIYLLSGMARSIYEAPMKDISDPDYSYNREDIGSEIILRNIARAYDFMYPWLSSGLREYIADAIYSGVYNWEQYGGVNQYMGSGVAADWASSHPSANNGFSTCALLAIYDDANLSPALKTKIDNFTLMRINRNIDYWNWVQYFVGSGYMQWDGLYTYNMYEYFLPLCEAMANTVTGMAAANFYNTYPNAFRNKLIVSNLSHIPQCHREIHLGDGGGHKASQHAVLATLKYRYPDLDVSWLSSGYYANYNYGSVEQRYVQAMLYDSPTTVTYPTVTDWFDPNVGLYLGKSDYTNSGATVTFYNHKLFRMQKAHADAGTFTFWKNGPLIVKNGNYDVGGGSSHFRYWYQQTYANNCVLVYDATETFNMDEDTPLSTVSDGTPNMGGQQWRRMVLASGDINLPDRQMGNTSCYIGSGFVDIQADITPAYWKYTEPTYTTVYVPKKVIDAYRQFVYIKPDILFIYDRVTSSDWKFPKYSLLHVQYQPTVSGALFATYSGGAITHYSGQSFSLSTAFNGGLYGQVVLPSGATIVKVGGPGYEWWDRFNSINRAPIMPDTISESNAGYYGNWRLDISPSGLQATDYFITVLKSVPSGVVMVSGISLSIQNSSYITTKIEDWYITVPANSGVYTLSGITYSGYSTTTAQKHLITSVSSSSGVHILGTYSGVYLKSNGLNTSNLINRAFITVTGLNTATNYGHNYSFYSGLDLTNSVIWLDANNIYDVTDQERVNTWQGMPLSNRYNASTYNNQIYEKPVYVKKDFTQFGSLCFATGLAASGMLAMPWQSTMPTLSGGYTMYMVFKLSNIATVSQTPILAIRGNPSTVGLEIRNSLGRMQVRFVDATRTDRLIYTADDSTGYLATDAWYIVTIVANPTLTVNQRLYFNSCLMASGTALTTIGEPAVSTTFFSIGSRYSSASIPTADPLEYLPSGYIAEVLVYASGMTGQSRYAVEQYLSRKYSINISGLSD